MYQLNIHAYEQISLSTAGIVMGVVLMVLHLYALLRPQHVIKLLQHAHLMTLPGQILLGIDFLWLAALLYDSTSNPLRMELFMFEPLRGILLLLCPIVWFVLCSMSREHLLPRALGFFLLLLAIVPMTAAFLKEPATRILIPLWWYPVLTIAMFWVAKPYLFRDEAAWLAARPRLFRFLAILGLAYSVLILICALYLWS